MKSSGGPIAVSDRSADLASRAQAARKVASQAKARWHQGESADALAVISKHDNLDWRRSIQLDLIYEEYCQRTTVGQSFDVETLCRRFPTFRSSIYRQVEVHRFLESHPELAELDADLKWPEPGEQLLEFTVIDELGRGAFGRVYLCTQPDVGDRQVVVKATFRQTHEPDTLGRLAHPNIVPIYSTDRDPDANLTTICMPYRGQATLADVIDSLFGNDRRPKRAVEVLAAVEDFERHGSFKATVNTPAPFRSKEGYVEGVVRLAAQLAEGLQHAHEKGIVHGDLKPSNVLIALDGTPMLLDFNLALLSKRVDVAYGGTLPYMAPEQIHATLLDADPPKHDPRSDIFSFGVVLYEFLCGTYPFGRFSPDWNTHQVAAELLERQEIGADDIATLNPDVDPHLANLIQRCLACEAQARPASMQEVVHDLRNLSGTWSKIRRWKSLHETAVALTALILLVAIGAFGFWMANRAPLSQRAYDQGLAHMMASERPAAIAQFDRAIQADPQFAEALFARGLARLRENRLQLALEDFGSAAKIAPEGRYMAFCGYCLNLLHHDSAAILWYEKSLSSDFRCPGVLNNLGYGYYQENKLDRAHQYLTQAIRLDSTTPVPYINRARVDLRRAMADSEYFPQNGIDDVETALKIHADDGPANFIAASLCGYAANQEPHNGEFKESCLKYLRTAAKLGAVPGPIRNIGSHPAFATLRGEQEFERLLRQQYQYEPVRRTTALMEPIAMSDRVLAAR